MENECLKITKKKNYGEEVYYVRLQPQVFDFCPSIEHKCSIQVNTLFKQAGGYRRYYGSIVGGEWNVVVKLSENMVKFGQGATFYVNPIELRYCGLGSYLMSKLIQWVQSHSEYASLQANVFPMPGSEAMLHPWYQRFGFRFDGVPQLVSSLQTLPTKENIEPFSCEILNQWITEHQEMQQNEIQID